MKSTDQLKEEARQAILAYKVRWLAEREYYSGIGFDVQTELTNLQHDTVVNLALLIRMERTVLKQQ